MARQSATRLLGAHAKAGVWPETRDDRPMENKQLQSAGIDCKSEQHIQVLKPT